MFGRYLDLIPYQFLHGTVTSIMIIIQVRTFTAFVSSLFVLLLLLYMAKGSGLRPGIWIHVFLRHISCLPFLKMNNSLFTVILRN